MSEPILTVKHLSTPPASIESNAGAEYWSVSAGQSPYTVLTFPSSRSKNWNMTVPEADVRRIIDHVDQHREELVAVLAELVRIRSVYPPGDYAEIAVRMEEAFSRLGARTAQVMAPKDRVEALGLTYPRPNVVAALGSGEGPILLIGTHMDVAVQVHHRSEWAHDPFGGDVSDGKIWGRGTCDAKCALAAQVFAARAIVECGCTLAGTLLLIASVDDEERFDHVKWPGMTFLVEEGLAAAGFPLPEMAINGESSRDSTAFAVRSKAVSVLRSRSLARPLTLQRLMASVQSKPLSFSSRV